MYKDIGRLTPKINKWYLEKKTNSNAFYDEIKPILFLFKIYGRTLYNESKGKMNMKCISTAGLYWLINFGVQTFLIILMLIDVIDELYKTSDFSRRIQLTMSMLVMPFHFYIPFSIGYESPKLGFFLRKWGEFQTQYELIFGQSYKTNFGNGLKILYIAVPITGILMSFVTTTVIKIGFWYHLIVYFFAFSGCHLLIAMWIVALLEMERASDFIKKRILTVTKPNLYNNPEKEICLLRHLWVDLSDLVTLLGNTGFVSMILIMAITQIALIMACYSFFSKFFTGNDGTISFLPICALVAFILFLILHMGQRSIDKVGCEVSLVLNSVDTTRLNQDAVHQVQLFISTVADNYPHINLGGFIIINSSTFSTMVNVVVTYLIVLVQFRIASLDKEKLFQKLNNNSLLNL